MYRVHNSTVSKQLRYSLSQESVHHPVSSDEAPYVVVECRREMLEAINLFAGTNIDIDEKEEAIDMCKEKK